MGKIDVTPNMKQEMISMRLARKSTYEIAEKFNVSSSWVGEKLNKWGIPKPPHYRQVFLSDVEKEEIINLYKEGMSVHSIGEKLGYTGDFIHKRLKKWGVKLRKPANKRSGEESPVWKNRENVGNWNRDDLYFWRKQVKERDGHKCRICGGGGKVTAHHLFSYAEYPELRSDTNNGFTLCKFHHLDFHVNFMGGCVKPCTPIDLFDYIVSMKEVINVN